MIKIENLCKKYGDNSILENVSTEINDGEVISIIGPSGCGKSTFIRCLNLLEKPTAGKIYIDGEDILDKNANVPKLREKMGMVFQNFNLFSNKMIAENIMAAPVDILGKDKNEAFKEAKELLRTVGLSGKEYAFPDELSGGQKQRVAIARAIAMKPKVLLLDEPTSALDPTMVDEVLQVLRKLAKQGMTMLIVTHEMEFARDVSSRIFFMSEKGIYEEGTAEEIFEHPKKPLTQSFIYKTSIFSYPVVNKSFDIYQLQSKLAGFLRKEKVDEKYFDYVFLMLEELIYYFVFKYGVLEFDLEAEFFKDIQGLAFRFVSDMIEKEKFEKHWEVFTNDPLSGKIVDRGTKEITFSDGSFRLLLKNE